MFLMIIFGLATASLAAPPQGYSLPTPSGGGFSHGSVGGGFSSGGFSSGSHGGGGYSGGGGGVSTGGGFVGGSHGSGGYSGGGGGVSTGGGFSGGFGGGVSGGFGGSCGNGQVRHVDGSCVEPIVNRNIYVYSAPALQAAAQVAAKAPKPRLDYNIVFVRTPETPAGQQPVVVPPAQQKTLIYVLTRNGQISQQVIEVPGGASHTPEVYYINYDEGDNPQLIGGIDLQSALSSATAQQGQVISGGSAGGSAGFSGGVSAGEFSGGAGVGFGGGSGGGYSGGSSGGFGGHSGGGASVSGGSFVQAPSRTYGAP